MVQDVVVDRTTRVWSLTHRQETDESETEADKKLKTDTGDSQRDCLTTLSITIFPRSVYYPQLGLQSPTILM